MISESRIQATIVSTFKRNGIQAIKQPSPPRGIPDLLVLVGGGKHFWIECKTATGQLLPWQKTFHRKLRKSGDQVYVCRSRDEALKALEDFQNA